MAHSYQTPTGKIPTKNRPFAEVVRDLRHAVFAVLRIRKIGDDQFKTEALGSGFFIGRNVFLTCHHVVNGPSSPHQTGDIYQLVSAFDGGSHGKAYTVPGTVGQELYLYPDQDAAILRVVTPDQHQAFLPVSYADPWEGQQIGVAGYPIPRLAVVDGKLTFKTFIFRVANGPITALYDATPAGTQHSAPIVEVNFLFVPGNSGGPIFEANTGRVLAYVHGYMPTIIKEMAQTASQISSPNEALNGQQYISSLHAIYSIGLRLGPLRHALESQGVTL